MAGLMNRIVVPLSVVLALVGIWVTGAATFKYSALMTQSQKLQLEISKLQAKQPIYTRVRQVLQDFAAYGQVQPALEPLLTKYGLKAQGATQPATPPTSTRPAAKGSSATGTGR